MLFVVKFLGIWLVASAILQALVAIYSIYGCLNSKEAFMERIEGMNVILCLILTVIALPTWLLYVLFKWIKGD